MHREPSALFVCTCTIGPHETKPKPVDWVGAVFIGGAVAVFVFGVVEAPARGWTHPLSGAAWPPASRWPLLFAIVELRRDHPLLDVRLFREPDFTTGAVGITVSVLRQVRLLLRRMQYMQLVLGYSPIKTALALAPVAIPIVALGATMHLHSSQSRPAAGGAVGLLLIAAGLFSMRLLDAGSAYIEIGLAVADHQRRHRVVHGANDFGDHERRAR